MALGHFWRGNRARAPFLVGFHGCIVVDGGGVGAGCTRSMHVKLLVNKTKKK